MAAKTTGNVSERRSASKLIKFVKYEFPFSLLSVVLFDLTEFIHLGLDFSASLRHIKSLPLELNRFNFSAFHSNTGDEIH